MTKLDVTCPACGSRFDPADLRERVAALPDLHHDRQEMCIDRAAVLDLLASKDAPVPPAEKPTPGRLPPRAFFWHRIRGHRAYWSRWGGAACNTCDKDFS